MLLDFSWLTYAVGIVVFEWKNKNLYSATGLEKGTVKGFAHKVKGESDDVITYETKLEIPADFGAIGAVLVDNRHNQELFLKDIVIYGIPTGPRFSCNSWLNPKSLNYDTRIFFTTKVNSKHPLHIFKIPLGYWQNKILNLTD